MTIYNHESSWRVVHSDVVDQSQTLAEYNKLKIVPVVPKVVAVGAVPEPRSLPVAYLLVPLKKLGRLICNRAVENPLPTAIPLTV